MVSGWLTIRRKGEFKGKISRKDSKGAENKKAPKVSAYRHRQAKIIRGSIASAEQVPSFSPTSPTKPITYLFSCILIYSLLSSVIWLMGKNRRLLGVLVVNPIPFSFEVGVVRAWPASQEKALVSARWSGFSGGPAEGLR